ncbi:MAG TPA: glycosyltransferase family 39 protein [bacterium]|nr:glycosyltransferase family 39 protein [bacterium]
MNIWSYLERRHALKTILMAALLIRLLFVCLLNPDRYYFSDARHYDGAAKSLLNGQGFGEKYHRAPLYPLVIAAVYSGFGCSFLSMRLFEAVLGVLLCWTIYRLAADLYGERTARWAALLAALFPHFILIAGILYPTHLYALLLTLSAYFLVQGDRRGKKWYLAASGALAGLAMLTVASFFFIAPFWMLWLLWTKGKPRWAALLVFAGVMALVIAPWTVRNYIHYGRVTLSQPLPHTALPNLQDRAAQEQEVASGFQSTVRHYKDHPTGTHEDGLLNTLRHYLLHPTATVQHMARELGHFWALYPDRLDIVQYSYRAHLHAKDSRMEINGNFWKWVKWPSILIMTPIFLLALYGALLAYRLDRRITWLWLLTFFSLGVGYSMIYSEVRYRIPLEPLILIWSALGVTKLLQHAQHADAEEAGSAALSQQAKEFN